MRNNWLTTLTLLAFASHLLGIVRGANPDTDEACLHWAEIGECDKVRSFYCR